MVEMRQAHLLFWVLQYAWFDQYHCELHYKTKSWSSGGGSRLWPWPLLLAGWLRRGRLSQGRDTLHCKTNTNPLALLTNLAKPGSNGSLVGWNFSRHNRGGKHGHWRRLQEPKEQVRKRDHFKIFADYVLIQCPFWPISRYHIDTNQLNFPKKDMEVSNYMKDGMIADWDTFEQVNLPLSAFIGKL